MLDYIFFEFVLRSKFNANPKIKNYQGENND